MGPAPRLGRELPRSPLRLSPWTTKDWAKNELGRVYTQGKAVETCALPARTCTELPNDTRWSGATPRFPCPSPCSQYHRPPPGAADSAPDHTTRLEHSA